MIALALSIGFLGSLHCVGMCGPLVWGTMQLNQQSNTSKAFQVILYTLSKAIAYGIIGFLVGAIGEFLFIGNTQKYFSIGAGIVLILLVIMSLDVEQALFKIPAFKSFYDKSFQSISKMIQKFGDKSVVVVGFLNGFLPCGLVYLALAGSLLYPSPFASGLFMFLFGLGTIPALLAVGVGFSFIQGKWRRQLRVVFPVVQFLVGAILIYRGIVVEAPMEISFWEAMNNPIWCH